jgi:hypothetical protein
VIQLYFAFSAPDTDFALPSVLDPGLARLVVLGGERDPVLGADPVVGAGDVDLKFADGHAEAGGEPDAWEFIPPVPRSARRANQLQIDTVGPRGGTSRAAQPFVAR